MNPVTTWSQVWPGPTQKNLGLLSKPTIHNDLSDFTKAQSDSVTPLPSQTSVNPHRPQDEISMTETASPSHISYHPPPQLSCPSQAFEHTIFSLQILYRVVPLPETVFLPSIFAWKGLENFHSACRSPIPLPSRSLSGPGWVSPWRRP